MKNNEQITKSLREIILMDIFCRQIFLSSHTNTLQFDRQYSIENIRPQLSDAYIRR